MPEAVSHPQRGLTAAGLKWIAMVLMFIDHCGASVFYRAYHGVFFAAPYKIYWLLRLIGRPAFPIYCFLLIEGFRHTRSRARYALRLVVFALLSEVPFDLAMYGKVLEFAHQNVYFSLCLGLLTVWAIDRLLGILKRDERVWVKVLCAAGAVLVTAAAAYFAQNILHCDYRQNGLLAIVAIYLGCYISKMPGFAAGCAVLAFFQGIEAASFVGLLPIGFYNGQRGKQNKYFFYLFYPVHLLLLACVCALLGI